MAKSTDASSVEGMGSTLGMRMTLTFPLFLTHRVDITDSGYRPRMFTYQHIVKLHDTDGYGILFFANQLRMCHDALQECWRAIGHPLLPNRHQLAVLPVVVHADSDYLAKIVVDDVLRISITLDHIGTTSCSLRYALINQHDVEVGRARTVHCAVDPTTDVKTPIPLALRLALGRI